MDNPEDVAFEEVEKEIDGLIKKTNKVLDKI